MKLLTFAALLPLLSPLGCAKTRTDVGERVPLKVSVAFPEKTDSSLSLNVDSGSASPSLQIDPSTGIDADKKSNYSRYLDPEILLQDASTRFTYKRAFRLFHYKISGANGVLKSGSIEIEDRLKNSLDAIDIEARSGESLKFEMSFLQLDFMNEKDADSFCYSGHPGYVRTWKVNETFTVKDGGEISLVLQESGRSTIHMAGLLIKPELLPADSSSPPKAGLRDTLTGFVWSKDFCVPDRLLPNGHSDQGFIARLPLFSVPIDSTQVVVKAPEFEIAATTTSPRNRNVMDQLIETNLLADLRITAAFRVEGGDLKNWTVARDSLVNILPRSFYPRLPMTVSVPAGNLNTYPQITVGNALVSRRGDFSTDALVEIIEDDGGQCERGRVLHSTVAQNQTPVLNPLLSRGAGTYRMRIRSYSPDGTEVCSSAPLEYSIDGFSVDNPRGKLALGARHTCAIQNNAVFCWGDNGNGQLGHGTTEIKLSPTRTTDLGGDAHAVFASENHTCAIVGSDRRLKCWGNVQSGASGTPTPTPTGTPGPGAMLTLNPVEIPGIQNTIHAAVNGSMSCAIVGSSATATVGNLNCWRNNSFNTQYLAVNIFAKRVSLSADALCISMNSTTGTPTEDVRCLGASELSSLSVATLSNLSTALPKISSIEGPILFSAGEQHICATANQKIYCSGNNSHGQLGDGTTSASTHFLEVTSLTNTVASGLAFGQSTCVMTTTGQVKCWGNNDSGQLGASEPIQVFIPTNVPGLESGVVEFAGGRNHACAVKDNWMRCWGNNEHGQLGLKSSTHTSANLGRPGISALQTYIPSFAVGGSYWTLGSTQQHICAIEKSRLLCWGSNTESQVGQSTPMDVHTPMLVGSDSDATTLVTAGRSHSCAVINGTLKCWGSNASGQLGTSNSGSSGSTQSSTPQPTAPSLTNIRAIAAGARHTCAVSGDQLYCWGRNQEQQLGTGGGFADYPNPTAVPSLAGGVSHIATGENHSCAIKNNQLYCWGSNGDNAIGNGGSGNWPPIVVPGMDSGISAAGAGSKHTCAVKNNQLFCWGSNVSGQLGFDSTVTQKTSPEMVPSMDSGVTDVAVGEEHTCAIKNRALYCWGRSDFGQVGDGSIDIIRPTAATLYKKVFGPQLIFPAGVTAVRAGAGTCAVLYDRHLKCWGTRFPGVDSRVFAPRTVVAP